MGKKNIFASSPVKRSLNYMSLGDNSLQLNEETEAGVASVWGQDEVLLKQSEEVRKQAIVLMGDFGVPLGRAAHWEASSVRGFWSWSVVVS